MRGDDDGHGTAAARLPLGAGGPLTERGPLTEAGPLTERGPLTQGGWVPRPPDAALAPASAPAPAGGLPLWARPWLQPASARHLGWVAVVAVLALVGSAWLLLHRSRPAPPSPVAVAAVAAPSSAPELQIVVDVGGRVHHPGLVTLPPGARVADALRAAGGALRPADIATLDLAARVSDGQLLLIGVPPPATGPGGAAAPVSLSSATVDQLDALPGIGPVLAKRIVDWREAHGGFTSLSQLEQVPGVGPRTFERLKSLVVL